MSSLMAFMGAVAVAIDAQIRDVATSATSTVECFAAVGGLVSLLMGAGFEIVQEIELGWPGRSG